jgi:hypothetical protein
MRGTPLVKKIVVLKVDFGNLVERDLNKWDDARSIRGNINE